MQKWIGVDVSKAELAVCVMDEEKSVVHATFANTTKGFGSLTNYLKKRMARRCVWKPPAPMVRHWRRICTNAATR